MDEVAAALVRLAAREAKEGARNLSSRLGIGKELLSVDVRREMVRTRLTFFVVGFYCLMILLLMGLVVFGKIDMSVAKELHATFLTPLTVLAGTSLGFYFGVGAYHEFSRDRPEQSLASVLAKTDGEPVRKP